MHSVGMHGYNGRTKMIITWNGIALEREEIKGIGVTGSKVILPFDSMDRVLGKAERIMKELFGDIMAELD